ncbi:MAG TPA: NUDIX domain-containing protein [Cytophagales bacterium]|nr:NUDIX domain-containing protein [Cytophagales bacterium]
MLFFINDTPLRITKKFDKYTSQSFDITIIDQQVFNEHALRGKILLKSPTTKQVLGLLNFLQRINNHAIKEVVVLTNDKKSHEELVKGAFKRIDAAGGLVLKGDKYLMIYRLGLWDLPKGKLDPGESMKQCALREVEEECCIKAELLYKIVDTWHSYTTKGGTDMLKRTSWYLMDLLDDSQMKPQIEEHIEDIQWMSKLGVQEALKKSYKSIAHVFEKYDKIKQMP